MTVNNEFVNGRCFYSPSFREGSFSETRRARKEPEVSTSPGCSYSAMNLPEPQLSRQPQCPQPRDGRSPPLPRWELRPGRNLASFFVEPMPVVLNPVLILNFEVLLVGLSHRSAVNPSTFLWWSMNSGIAPILLSPAFPGGLATYFNKATKTQTCQGWGRAPLLTQ